MRSYTKYSRDNSNDRGARENVKNLTNRHAGLKPIQASHNRYRSGLCPVHPRALARHAVRICAAMLAVSLIAPPAFGQSARVKDWLADLPGFTAPGNNKGRTPAQRLSERKRFRKQLSLRMETEFQSLDPLVSQSTIASLIGTIQRYRKIVAANGWRKIPGDKIRRTESGNQVSLLRRRLFMTGDLTKFKRRRRTVFDDELEVAVARFQKRHGLRITGFVDRWTLRALNLPASTRLRQLEFNLARIRELYEANAVERYVIVNVPAFQLEAVDGERLALRSNVVVGRADRETPSISAKIIGLNFLPFWRVPDSIAAKDLIPQIRKDRSYFREQHFSLLKKWGAEPIDPNRIDWESPDIYNYKFRQDPGSYNALGLVRINMPNKEIVYLHDTPLKKLFGSTHRAYSSGCVRVEKVADLVSWLLREEEEDDWSRERVELTMQNGVSTDVRLKEPVRVHFTYVTAWATENGAAHFRQDLYGRDGKAEFYADEEDENVASVAAITP